MQWGAAVPVIYSPGQVPSSGFAINQSTSRTLQAYQVTDQFSCVCVHIGRRCTAHELDLGDSAPAAFLRSNPRQTFSRWSRWKYVLARGTSWQQGERRDRRLLLWELLCLRVVASIEGRSDTRTGRSSTHSQQLECPFKDALWVDHTIELFFRNFDAFAKSFPFSSSQQLFLFFPHSQIKYFS